MLMGFVPVVPHTRLPEDNAAATLHDDVRDSVYYVALCVALACCFLILVTLFTPVVYVNGVR